jgi:hypothetical protein
MSIAELVLAGDPRLSSFLTAAPGLVYDASTLDPSDWPELEAELNRIFQLSQEAVLAGVPVVYVIHEPSIWGHDAPLRAALATALMGGMRSGAIETARAGVAFNAIAVSDDVDLADLARNVSFLLASSLTGQLLTAGSTHLGRPAA